MKINELLEGATIRATKDCWDAKKGQVYKVAKYYDICLMIANENGNGCICINTWEIISPINYKPKPHKHVLKCFECGEEVKK